MLAKELPLRSILCDMSALFANDSYEQKDDDENDEQKMTQEEDDDEEDSSSLSTSLRVDADRTTPYEKSIFYMNNTERDAQYQQCSYSLQTLSYSSM